MNFPILVLALSFVLLFLAAHIGDFLRNRVFPLNEDARNDFGVVLGATLTLLGLLIGFSFSMAVSRTISQAERKGLTHRHRAGPDLLLPADQGECASC